MVSSGRRPLFKVDGVRIGSLLGFSEQLLQEDFHGPDCF